MSVENDRACFYVRAVKSYRCIASSAYVFKRRQFISIEQVCGSYPLAVTNRRRSQMFIVKNCDWLISLTNANIIIAVSHCICVMRKSSSWYLINQISSVSHYELSWCTTHFYGVFWQKISFLYNWQCKHILWRDDWTIHLLITSHKSPTRLQTLRDHANQNGATVGL